MPTTLTDADSFDAPAIVPVDGDPATASSVIAEFQVLQNRTLNCKNAAATAKAEIDGLYGQVSGTLQVVASQQIDHAGGLLDSQIPTSFKSVTNGNFQVHVVAGDRLYITVGPIDFKATGTVGGFRVRITEDILGSTLPQADDDRTYYDTGYRSLTIPIVYPVVKTGILSVDLQISGDGAMGSVAGTNGSVHFASYELLRVIT